MPILNRIVDSLLFGSHRFALPLQGVAQRLLRGPRPAMFLLDGHKFHCTTAHKYYFVRENYERDLWPILERAVNKESVVYEVGAHFGFWVVRLSDLVRQIYAFEPSQSNLAFLRKNVQGLPNVKIIEAAAGATTGEVAFSEGGSMSAVGEGKVKVPMLTLDQFSKQHKLPNVVLLDVEGYAGEVLQGASEVLATHPTIVCEIHSPTEASAVGAHLRDHGYKVDLPASPHFPYRTLAE